MTGPAHGGTTTTAELADRLAAAVAGCPGVARLAGGPIATYLAGRTVAGVAVRDGAVRVAVVAWYGQRLPEVADQVRAAVAPLVPGWPVTVYIEDVVAGGTGGTGPGDPAG